MTRLDSEQSKSRSLPLELDAFNKIIKQTNIDFDQPNLNLFSGYILTVFAIYPVRVGQYLANVTHQVTARMLIYTPSQH
jgi:hypothetical protein